MSFHSILNIAHGSSALLLLALAIISVLIAVLIAVKPAVDPANERLLARANLVGRIEIIVGLCVTLTGLVAMSIGAWPITQLWLWLSLTIMVFYIAALQWITKPARLAVAKGGSEIKSGMQVVLQMGHVLLLFGAFALMQLKPV
jgi:hypothetical protein